ncbi:hypothetical protein CALVIDRAFT_60631 [Calocera viscosa TUFC12733]|uniref:Uncharacterized protein n=1 Tax=Calocera viscosa (strain TUFC12733) TaxID=1330018 RepID=A0A167NK05_CALVF|nr:hypothetical protein CALVIDRAFT_60631 [Calocera viscosa TUFC12733]
MRLLLIPPLTALCPSHPSGHQHRSCTGTGIDLGARIPESEQLEIPASSEKRMPSAALQARIAAFESPPSSTTTTSSPAAPRRMSGHTAQHPYQHTHPLDAPSPSSPTSLSLAGIPVLSPQRPNPPSVILGLPPPKPSGPAIGTMPVGAGAGLRKVPPPPVNTTYAPYVPKRNTGPPLPPRKPTTPTPSQQQQQQQQYPTSYPPRLPTRTPPLQGKPSLTSLRSSSSTRSAQSLQSLQSAQSVGQSRSSVHSPPPAMLSASSTGTGMGMGQGLTPPPRTLGKHAHTPSTGSFQSVSLSADEDERLPTTSTSTSRPVLGPGFAGSGSLQAQAPGQAEMDHSPDPDSDLERTTTSSFDMVDTSPISPVSKGLSRWESIGSPDPETELETETEDERTPVVVAWQTPRPGVGAVGLGYGHRKPVPASAPVSPPGGVAGRRLPPPHTSSVSLSGTGGSLCGTSALPSRSAGGEGQRRPPIPPTAYERYTALFERNVRASSAGGGSGSRGGSAFTLLGGGGGGGGGSASASYTTISPSGTISFASPSLGSAAATNRAPSGPAEGSQLPTRSEVSNISSSTAFSTITSGSGSTGPSTSGSTNPSSTSGSTRTASPAPGPGKPRARERTSAGWRGTSIDGFPPFTAAVADGAGTSEGPGRGWERQSHSHSPVPAPAQQMPMFWMQGQAGPGAGVGKEKLKGYVVKAIWGLSKLPREKLQEIWCVLPLSLSSGHEMRVLMHPRAGTNVILPRRARSIRRRLRTGCGGSTRSCGGHGSGLARGQKAGGDLRVQQGLNLSAVRGVRERKNVFIQLMLQ